MHTIRSWFAQKIDGPVLAVKEESRATEEWKRFTGRGHYAKVSLAAYPAHSFEFVSAKGAWPSEEAQNEYEQNVLDGIVSELLASSGTPVLGVRIVVESAVVHEIESNGNSFFYAAKRAAEKLLEGASGQYRGNCTKIDA